jgi:transcriptional regulator with XRE-family HTH domain
MAKTLHSRHNKIFLAMLRELRRSRGLRQRDLGAKLGHGQAKVSNVERGERRLDVIELRDWLDALDEKLSDFTSKLDAELGQAGELDRSVQLGPRSLSGTSAELPPQGASDCPSCTN